MISLIVPVYNGRKTIQRLIDSIPEEWETIIVEDGSTDPIDLPDINGLYISQENMGPGGARNTGLKHASGDRILFADADDEIIPFPWEQFNNDVVYAGFYDNGEAKLTKPFGCVYGVSYKREFIEKHGIQFPLWMQREDIVFNTLCQALTDDWITVYAGTYIRHDTEGSITNTRDFNRTELPFLAKEIVYIWNFLKGSETARTLCTRTLAYMFWLYQAMRLTTQEKETFWQETWIDFEPVNLKTYLDKNKEALEKRIGKFEQTLTFGEFLEERNEFQR